MLSAIVVGTTNWVCWCWKFCVGNPAKRVLPSQVIPTIRLVVQHEPHQPQDRATAVEEHPLGWSQPSTPGLDWRWRGCGVHSSRVAHLGQEGVKKSWWGGVGFGLAACVARLAELHASSSTADRNAGRQPH